MNQPNDPSSRQQATSDRRGANSNGSHHGLNGSKPEPFSVAPAARQSVNFDDNFDQPVVLRQSPKWSRAIVWSLIGVTTAVVTWACIVKTDEAVMATGKLEPEGTVAEVQAPVGGVVKDVLVKDGQKVQKGDVLVKMDPTSTKAEQDSLKKIRASLIKENEFYRTQMQGGSPRAIPDAPISSEELALTRNRAALLEENQLYRMQVVGSKTGAGLSPEQELRFLSSQSEIASRVNAAELEVGQIQRQLEQAQSQLAVSRELLAGEEKILGRLTTLWKEGGIAQLQYEQQQQQVRTRQGEVEKLEKEISRLLLAIAQSGQKVQNTVAFTRTDLLARITDNEKRIAEIESQLMKSIVENEKRIAEIDAKLRQNQLTLTYQDLTAPVSGTVFDLQARNPGYVATNTTPLLKIVPGDFLVAKVFITNKDIGFVRENMLVDVRVDSFPFSEFGDIKGHLVWIGSDALPPDQVYPFYRFPAKVRLDRQTISANGRPIDLQSGMSVSTNIIIRKRPVISIFTDLFSKKVDSLRFVR